MLFTIKTYFNCLDIKFNFTLTFTNENVFIFYLIILSICILLELLYVFSDR